MKTPNFTKLLILLISINGVTYAQNSKGKKEEKDSATVIVLGQDNDPSVKSKAIKSFEENVRAGLQSDGIPRFLITDSKANAIFAIGGFVQFRTGYDFGGVIDHLDFIPYSIAVEPLDGNDRRFLMDASTSRLYFKTLIQTKKEYLKDICLRTSEGQIKHFGYEKPIFLIWEPLSDKHFQPFAT